MISATEDEATYISEAAGDAEETATGVLVRVTGAVSGDFSDESVGTAGASESVATADFCG